MGVSYTRYLLSCYVHISPTPYPYNDSFPRLFGIKISQRVTFIRRYYFLILILYFAEEIAGKICCKELVLIASDQDLSVVKEKMSSTDQYSQFGVGATQN